MIEIETSGNAFERGVQQGTQLAKQLAAITHVLSSIPLLPGWIPDGVQRGLVGVGVRWLGGRYLSGHRALLEGRFGGDELATLRGLAEGSGLSEAMLYGVHAVESESCHVGFTMGCTSLAIPASRMRDAKPRLAYNHDFPPAFQPQLIVRRSDPEGHFRSMVLTYPPLIGCIAGVNERGLAVSVNQAYATDMSRARPATFVTMLLQTCLDRCATTREALALIDATAVTNGAFITLVDETGDRACIELSPTRRRHRDDPPQDILYTFNKYRTAEMESVEVPIGAVTTAPAAGFDVHACNITRERRFLELAPQTQLDGDDIFAILSDHEGGTGDHNTICRHGDPFGETILSAVIDPVRRSIAAVVGKPCENRPKRYDLTPTSPSRTARDNHACPA